MSNFFFPFTEVADYFFFFIFYYIRVCAFILHKSALFIQVCCGNCTARHNIFVLSVFYPWLLSFNSVHFYSMDLF